MWIWVGVLIMIGGTVLGLIPNAAPVRVAAPARIETAPAEAGRLSCGDFRLRSQTSWSEMDNQRWDRQSEIKESEIVKSLPNSVARLQVALLCLAVFAFLGAGDESARFNSLGHRLMCVCGCNQILLECNHVGCTYSDRMRGELDGGSGSWRERRFDVCRTSCRNTVPRCWPRRPPPVSTG